MKVLHIIDSFGLYGAEMLLLNLMVQQRQKGVECVLLCLEPGGGGKSNSLTRHALKQGFVVEQPSISGGFNFKQPKLIEEIAIKHDVDVIHSHGYKGNILLSLLTRQKVQMPRVSTVHGWIATKPFTKIWVYKKMDFFALKCMDAVVNVNDVLPRVACRKGTHIVPNGICCPPFNPGYVETHYPDDHDFLNRGYVVGTIARLSAEKGISYLLDAMRLLADKNDDYRLVIVGDGPLRKELELYAKHLNISDRVLLTGYRPEAFNYLKYFQIFVLPSISEGLPITLLEAMHGSVPIVASCVGGIPKLLENGNGGRLVEPSNVDQLFSAIHGLRTYPDEALQLSRESKRIVSKNYSIEVMEREYYRVYQLVAKG